MSEVVSRKLAKIGDADWWYAARDWGGVRVRATSRISEQDAVGKLRAMTEGWAHE